MATSEGWVLGVDGGGTKTRYAACDSNGRVVGYSEGVGTNPSIGVETAAARLAAGLDVFQQMTGLTLAASRGVVLAIAGTAHNVTAVSAFRDVLHSRGCASPALAVGDYRAAWAGAVSGHSGIVIASGTGSFAYGEKADGSNHLSGGWGALFGDEGSGYNLGCQALRACAQAVDGRGPATQLVAEVQRHFAVDTLRHVAQLLRRDGDLIRRVAGLAPCVFAAADRGDAVAAALAEQGVTDLTTAVQTIHRQLFSAGGCASVHYAGATLAGSAMYRRLLARRLRNDCQLLLRKPNLSPVGGALLLALGQWKPSICWEVVAAELAKAEKIKG